MTGQRGREPSMEEILASIRTIINQTEAQSPPPPEAAATTPSPAFAPPVSMPPPAPAEDVLELTEQAPPLPAPAAPSAAPRGPTLEETVQAMLAPMLRQWLDANLPAIVEDVAIREVRRLSGRE